MAHMNLWLYFANASFVVKVIMFILVATSLISWTIMIQREFFIKKLRSKVDKFENQFWSGSNLTKLYTSLDEAQTMEGLSAIFYVGFKEFVRLNKQPGIKTQEILDSSQRAMRIAQQRDINRLENHLPFLASVGSVSPYIGLFGTVWGIIIALHALGTVEQASFAMVAPSLSEALIATAMGLFAAIPAVLAYNRFTTEANSLANQYEIFREEFITILQHQVGKKG